MDNIGINEFKYGAKPHIDCGKDPNQYGEPKKLSLQLTHMARISEELKAKAIEMGIEGPHTSWWHMFGWNVFGLLLFGPAVATHRFFNTLNKVESELNRRADYEITIDQV